MSPPTPTPGIPSPRQESLPPDPPPLKKQPERSWGWILTSLILLVMLITSVIFTIYLWTTSNAWQERTSDLNTRINSMADTIATVEEERDSIQDALEDSETQLDNARDRISSLADEKAQLGDDHAAQQQLVEYQQNISDLAADVVYSLDECVVGQQDLIEYLEDPDLYDTTDLKRFQREVNEYCQEATDASDTLMAELDNE